MLTQPKRGEMKKMPTGYLHEQPSFSNLRLRFCSSLINCNSIPSSDAFSPICSIHSWSKRINVIFGDFSPFVELLSAAGFGCNDGSGTGGSSGNTFICAGFLWEIIQHRFDRILLMRLATMIYWWLMYL